ncbi:tRNA pseudouridine(55) synthase TruB [Salibacterium lacus]|uniref:tRNA pseudouridine synthase B n=1 Tax=Salibacterium lacus TaxID=1898109 RepID=A0ABW5SYH6_9BACI
MEDMVIPLYKDRGLTSHDCVNRIRRLYGVKKAGHTGTLDPDVEGVLPVCIGRATKIADYMTDADKQYEAEITLGYATTTEDASGTVTETQPVMKIPSEKQLKDTFHTFEGEQKQIPPMYSAVKVNGKKLYEYAREGKTVERPARDIAIHELQYLEETFTAGTETVSFSIRVTCSKGTFIRTLAVDIGRALGFPAHMSDLKRTRSGPVDVGSCYTFEELEAKKDNDTLDETGLSIETALQHLPSVEVTKETAADIRNGRLLPAESGPKGDSPFLFLHQNRAVAVYQIHPEKPWLIKPKTMLQLAPQQSTSGNS